MKPYLMSGDRSVIHFEMELGALIGMRQRHLFIELDAEAGLGRQEYPSRLPDARLLQYLRMEAIPGFDAFEDQEIGQRGGEVDIGGPLHRSRIEMGCYLRVMSFGHRGDLLRLHDAADPAQRHLQDRGSACLEH